MEIGTGIVCNYFLAFLPPGFRSEWRLNSGPKTADLDLIMETFADLHHVNKIYVVGQPGLTVAFICILRSTVFVLSRGGRVQLPAG